MKRAEELYISFRRGEPDSDEFAEDVTTWAREAFAAVYDIAWEAGYDPRKYTVVFSARLEEVE